MDYRIMIIGDDQKSANEIVLLLNKEGINTIEVCHGTYFIEKLIETSPDLAIVDKGSGALGWLVGSQIRHKSDVPIILLGTLNADNEIAWVKAAAHGIDYYLARPFSSMELVARIKALIRRRENNQHRFHHSEESESCLLSTSGAPNSMHQ
jgi:two-component system, OmpR family, response regulator RegX3